MRREEMMDVAHSGRFIGRDISKGEHVETDLNNLIERRHQQLVAMEGERREEEDWQKTERAHAAARAEQMRTAWCEYHQEQAERHRAVERHQDRCYHDPQLRGD
jgi:hypothetical protein